MRVPALLAIALLGCGEQDGVVTATSGAGASTSTSSVAATSGSSQGGSAPGAGGAGGSASADADGDGIDDAAEQTMAHDYFPFLSLQPNDQCPLHGVLYRLSPHPADPSKVHILYDVLYERDCGLNGHVGDNEAMGVLADPNVAAPDGILAVRSISHQATVCERVTTCGSVAGCSPCVTAERNGAMYPVAYSSKDKHGGYVNESTCDSSVICDAGGCGLNSAADDPPLYNAGEPGAPLLNNLTTQGFITQANGWTEQELFDFDPWGMSDFGGAGHVAGDLADPAFVIDPNGC